MEINHTLRISVHYLGENHCQNNYSYHIYGVNDCKYGINLLVHVGNCFFLVGDLFGHILLIQNPFYKERSKEHLDSYKDNINED